MHPKEKLQSTQFFKHGQYAFKSGFDNSRTVGGLPPIPHIVFIFPCKIAKNVFALLLHNEMIR